MRPQPRRQKKELLCLLNFGSSSQRKGQWPRPGTPGVWRHTRAPGGAVHQRRQRLPGATTEGPRGGAPTAGTPVGLWRGGSSRGEGAAPSGGPKPRRSSRMFSRKGQALKELHRQNWELSHAPQPWDTAEQRARWGCGYGQGQRHEPPPAPGRLTPTCP